MWDEITYTCPNFNGANVEIWEWLINFIPHFTGHVITYLCSDSSWSMLLKEATGHHQSWYWPWFSKSHVFFCDLASCFLFCIFTRSEKLVLKIINSRKQFKKKNHVWFGTEHLTRYGPGTVMHWDEQSQVLVNNVGFLSDLQHVKG